VAEWVLAIGITPDILDTIERVLMLFIWSRNEVFSRAVDG
jgi:hypothetical protein